ncbi:MAG: RNase adapter RapZ [Gammaproteobacteria bacterium]|nr:MAG: RNase adapter RapZ [Gammaproteobacteria bacterium]
MKLIIVSGLSGSGKSVALGTLEDLGYYCIDNLPAGLLPNFARQMLLSDDGAVNRLSAVAIDARNMVQDIRDFSDVLKEIRELEVPIEILFLDTEKETLVRRFSETRRKHPLTNADTSLAEAIDEEASLLSEISGFADLRIDTTHTNVHQLRDMLVQRVVKKNSNSFSILLTSFGFKNGVPVDANFVFDVRCLPNPHWDPQLRKLTGLDNDVELFLARQEDVVDMLADIKHYLQKWLPRYAKENRSYLTIAVGCTGGQHRSVFLVEQIAKSLRDQYASLLVRHRELI